MKRAHDQLGSGILAVILCRDLYGGRDLSMQRNAFSFPYFVSIFQKLHRQFFVVRTMCM